MLSSGGWATNVKENETVEFRAYEDSIVSAEIFSALSLLFPQLYQMSQKIQEQAQSQETGDRFRT